MQKERWTKQELRVKNAFSGGKTYAEVDIILKGKPKRRQLDNIVKKFKRAGEMVDLNEGERGRTPHKFIPTSNSFGPERPSIKFHEEDFHKNENSRAEDEAIANIFDDVKEVRTVLVANRRCRTPKRIREICNQWIEPVVSDIMDLRSATKHEIRFDIDLQKLHPGIFFTETYNPTRRHKSSLEREGTLRVRHPASTSEDEWFKPTLTEWEKYFEAVFDATVNIGQWYRISEKMKLEETNEH